MKFSIFRFNPEHDEKPCMQDYEIEPQPGEIMLLDVILRIKAMGNTLTFRKSCREGVCGSDAMNINGRNGLACITPVRGLKEPVCWNNSSLSTTCEASSPSAACRSRLRHGLYECILCGCCTSQCPSSWWNPEKFVGPAGLLQAERFIADSRDRATRDRLDDLKGAYRLFRCRTIMNCTEVCPKGLGPSRAIEKIRLMLVKESF